jgi:hypothetical protein
MQLMRILFRLMTTLFFSFAVLLAGGTAPAMASQDPGGSDTHWPNAYTWVIDSGTNTVVFSEFDDVADLWTTYRVTTNWTVSSNSATLKTIKITNLGASIVMAQVYSQDGSPLSVSWGTGATLAKVGSSVTITVNHKYATTSGKRITQIAFRWMNATTTFSNAIQFKRW